MKLKCPACGTPVASENINIRSMTAVCSNCDNVFTFNAVTAQRMRKLKAPPQFTIHEDDTHLWHFSFKWSWRTEPVFGVVALLLVLIGGMAMFAGGLAEGLQGELLIPLWMMLLPAYVFTTLHFNSTHYQLDGDTLRVYTTPLWFPYYGRRSLPVWEISRVTTERAFGMPNASAREAFYNVYVHTTDGHQIMVARVVNYEHAHYIAQEIQAVADQYQDVSESDFETLPQSHLADDVFEDDANFDDNIDSHLRAGQR